MLIFPITYLKTLRILMFSVCGVVLGFQILGNEDGKSLSVLMEELNQSVEKQEFIASLELLEEIEAQLHLGLANIYHDILLDIEIEDWELKESRVEPSASRPFDQGDRVSMTLIKGDEEIVIQLVDRSPAYPSMKMLVKNPAFIVGEHCEVIRIGKHPAVFELESSGRINLKIVLEPSVLVTLKAENMSRSDVLRFAKKLNLNAIASASKK